MLWLKLTRISAELLKMCIHLGHHVICWVLVAQKLTCVLSSGSIPSDTLPSSERWFLIHGLAQFCLWMTAFIQEWSWHSNMQKQGHTSRWGQKRHVLFTSLSFKAKGKSFPESLIFFLVSLAELCHMIIPGQSLVSWNWSALISLNQESLLGAAGCHLNDIRISLPRKKGGNGMG